MRLSLTRAMFLLPLLLLTGCGNDRPVPSQSSSTYQAAARTPQPAVSTASASDDPLLGQQGAAADDPLLSGGNSSSDPMQTSDPLQGRKMPTDHSHWLRGSIRGERLTVLLNGVRQGTYSGLVDKDITMRLRKGINSVTFVCDPHQADAAAQIDLVESEHHPPIAPLVTFQSQPLAQDAKFESTTQTFTFFAN